MEPRKIVSREEWLVARKAHLAKEKALTRARDELSRQRRELPWVKVEKPYLFDGPNGKETLADLFDGRSQLIVKHFMLGPGWQEGCVGCSFHADHVDGARPGECLFLRQMRLARNQPFFPGDDFARFHMRLLLIVRPSRLRACRAPRSSPCDDCRGRFRRRTARAGASEGSRRRRA